MKHRFLALTLVAGLAAISGTAQADKLADI